MCLYTTYIHTPHHLGSSITPAFLGSLHNPSTWAMSIPCPKGRSGKALGQFE